MTIRLGGILLSLFALASACLSYGDNKGATVFHEHCAVCHADNGSGKTASNKKVKVPDLRSKAVQAKSDEQLFDSIANGTKHHEYPHGFLHTGLTKGDINELVAHIRTMK